MPSSLCMLLPSLPHRNQPRTPLAPASERRGLRNGRRRASASSAPPLPPCLLRIRLSSARLTSHRSPASLCRSWPLAFFFVAGYACEEGGGAAARGSRCSGVRPTVPHLSCAQVPCPRDRVLGSRLQQRRGITNNASAHRGSAYNSGHRGGSRKQGLFAEHKDRTYLCRYLDSRQLSTKYNLCIQKIKVAPLLVVRIRIILLFL
ncbi:uncharacterized protein LOC110434218 isoform X2 [Sorghum bicolor]|uniref:uncharacterized protein LOC110434218 isoform X2 n=1 Tax=Sorghum bicolor TaxID=4558 RepID=UPI000B426509|nr:uncharacterized protein LOC110434218 isoform X2 [Sorghum bicolor]XP_021313747.1 uncharacterized protein LOC110434218 isoform X2 [Sorghum bicolor]|eukprot:XP_021313746.1 uncharacterized protein LOC110434218 isoform X2 [Sorghum bicolor]